MRLVAPLGLVLLSMASTAWGQSQVPDSASNSSDPVTDPAPLPGPDYRTAPSRPDPKAIHDVAPTPVADEPQLRAGAPYVDQLSGHWTIGASLAYATLLGNFSSQLPIGDRLGGSYQLSFDAGYGLTANWEVALAGDYTDNASGDSCPSCSAVTYGAGPRVRYHLVGGTRFSPWVAYGLTFRKTRFEKLHDSAELFALEPVRLEVGGAWYITSGIALGPVLSTAIARTIATDDTGDGRWHVQLAAGLRFLLDPVGR